MERFIHGIQQVGIGVADAEAAFSWYKKIFGTDIVVFKDTAIAGLMKQYTGNVAQKRHAILAMNMQGGGGFEMWQYADKNPLAPPFEISLGDTGVFATKIRCKDIAATFEFYKNEVVHILTRPAINPENKNHFYIKDPWNNTFEIIENDYWFANENKLTGAVCGVVIGVSDMEASINFYSNVLGFDIVVSDTDSVYKDFDGLQGSNRKCRRVILRKN